MADEEDGSLKIQSLESELSDSTKKLSEALEKVDRTEKALAKTERQLDKANAYNEELCQQIQDLSKEIQEYRNRKRDVEHVGVQAVAEEILTEQGEKPLPQWNETPALVKESEDPQPSIAESLKQTAEAALAQSGFVFDEASGLYYDYNSGYYYNCEQGLYYDPGSGTYFYYDDATQEYTFHSQVAPQQYTCSTGQRARKDDKTNKNRKRSKEKKKDKDKEPADRKKKKRKREKDDKENSKYSHKHRKKHKKHKGDNSSDSNRKSDREASRNGKHDKDSEHESRRTERRHRKHRKSKHSRHKHDTDDPEDKKAAMEGSENQESDVEMGEIVESKDQEIQEKVLSEVSSGSLATGESELESGELTSSDEQNKETEDSSSSSESEEEEEEETEYAVPLEQELEQEDVAGGWPPCIRVMVTESDCLQPGTLFIVTCDGCTVGREKDMNHLIRIPDINVSKMHAQIKYDQEADSYVVVDCGSQNGTFLNGKCISSSTCEDSVRALSHGDSLQLGMTTLLLHIHPGTDTCDDCEPGQVLSKLQALEKASREVVIRSKAEKQKVQRQQLKQIKKKYGLENSAYVNDSVNNPLYEDKAATRRRDVGSDNPHIRDEAPASVMKPISSENKGRKLLAKMGWKEGEGLGKDNAGISEPINVLLRTNQSAGLGSASAVEKSLDDVHTAQKSQRWLHAQRRYNNLDKGQTKGPVNLSFAFKTGQPINVGPKVDLGADDDVEKAENG